MSSINVKETIKLYDKILDTRQYLELMGYTDHTPDRDFKICCPIHDETEPSFSYSKSMGIWTCFGACHTSGKVVKLHYMILQKTYGKDLSIVGAIEDLYTLFPHILPKPVENQSISWNINTDKIMRNINNELNRSNKKKLKVLPRNINLNDFILLEFLRKYMGEE